MDKKEIDLNALCWQYHKEGVTGAISFKAGFYKILCAELKINYKDLSRVGKAVLKSDAIDTMSLRQGDNFKQGQYYLKFK